MRPASALDRLARVAAVLILALGTPAALAGKGDRGEIRLLLAKMADAVHTLNYDGTFVYLHDDQLESMRVLHTVDASGEKEQLISLNGAAREVVRDAASVTCIAPESRSVSIGNRFRSGSFGAVFSVDLEELEHFYDFHLLGSTRVADRPTRAIGIIPKDQFRFGYRLFIDAHHGFPLKTDLLDAEGRVISQIMFTALTVGPSVRLDAEETMEGKEDFAWRLSQPRLKVSETEKVSWRFNALPSGFKVNVQSRRRAGKGRAEMEHFVLSDGLASVSVYVEKRRAGEGFRGASGMGAVNAFGSEVSGHDVTVVGQVPAETVRAVAEALEYLADGGRDR